MASNIKQFKGLAQHINESELSPEYCHTLINLDVDDPLGQLTKRGGHTKKYTDSFTDVIKAIEYKYPTSGDSILLFNDNGTLKYYTNGGSLSSLSLPSGAALESNFRNQFFGYQDHVIITAGNGSTNYVLGFYYVKRVNSSDTGLFGNVEEHTGYKLLKSQLIPPNGTFSRVYNAIEHNSYYYFTFRDTTYIEKRDSDFHLVDRFNAHSDAANGDKICLAEDGTNVFMAIDDTIYRINATGWVVEESATLGTNPAVGIAVNDANLYIATTSALYRYVKSNLSAGAGATDSTGFVGIDVACDKDGSETYIWAINDNGTNPAVERRNDSTLVVDTTSAEYSGLKHLYFTDNVFVTREDSDEILEMDHTDVSAALVNTFTHVEQPHALFEQSSDGLKVFSERYGLLADDSTASLYKPDLVSVHVDSVSGSGSLAAGTYFYKVSIVDTDGQEFTLSDPVITTFSAVSDVGITVICNESQLDDLYRVQSINLYRAYNSTENASAPATNYKLLETIDINDTGWSNNATLSFYYYDFTDDTAESSISSVTFEENTGFSENTKPRYVNYKVHEWVDNQLHVANFYVDGDNYDNTIIKSQVNAPDVVPFANTYNFRPYDGDEIKNITTAYNRAYVMKEKETGVFYNDEEERIFTWGIADVDSFVKIGDVLYLMGNKGIVEINGSTVNRISDPVITDFEAISSFTDANVFFRDDKQRIFFSLPGTKVLVFNRQYNLWTTYNDDYAFTGFFKNIANEYIGYGAVVGLSNHFFYHLDDDAQDKGDTDISISYESPVLKFGDNYGEDVELIKMQYRLDKTGTINFILYSYTAGSKATLETISMADPSSSDLAVKTKYLSDAWGESFGIGISGSCSNFKFSGISLYGVAAGETANV